MHRASTAAKVHVSLTGGKNAAHEVLLARDGADYGVPRAPNAVLNTPPAKSYDPEKRRKSTRKTGLCIGDGEEHRHRHRHRHLHLHRRLHRHRRGRAHGDSDARTLYGASLRNANAIACSVFECSPDLVLVLMLS